MATQEAGGCDPWRAVYAVADMLREQGIPARMVGEDISNARAAAVDLLAAFGVEPVLTPEDEQ